MNICETNKTAQAKADATPKEILEGKPSGATHYAIIGGVGGVGGSSQVI